MYCAVPRIGNILALVFLNTEDERGSGVGGGMVRSGWVGGYLPVDSGLLF